jgi:hypothetical protein
MACFDLDEVGALVALTWAAVDLAAQSYHYTPVYATEPVSP